MPPLITLKVKIQNTEASDLYDHGSNITIMLYDSLKKKFTKTQFKKKPLTFKTMSGEAKFVGLAMIKLKIFDIEKNIPVCVIDKPHFKYDLLIGLDTIKSFKLCQDENLVISQTSPKQNPGTITKIPTTVNNINPLLSLDPQVSLEEPIFLKNSTFFVYRPK